MRNKILVIDDEEALCEILKFNLQKEGYEVDCAYSAEEALRKDLSVYRLFIVDIMMGTLSGFDFVREVRNQPDLESIPAIFCSALGDEDDKVLGLNIGGDDYVTKPFVISEVVARVRAVLRRAAAHQQNKQQQTAATQEADAPIYEDDIVFRKLRIDRNEKRCYLNNEDMGLTRTEYDLLLFLLTHRNKVYSREEIIHFVWPNDVFVSNRTIDTNITRLRKKMGEYGVNIITRQGFGYGFKEAI